MMEHSEPLQDIHRLRKKVQEQHQSNDTHGSSWFNNETKAKDTLIRLAHALEQALGQGAVGECNSNVGGPGSILEEIEETYRRITLGSLLQSNLATNVTLKTASSGWLERLNATTPPADDEDDCRVIVESCLDWAIASKRAGSLLECLLAHQLYKHCVFYSRDTKRTSLSIFPWNNDSLHLESILLHPQQELGSSISTSAYVH